MTPKKTAGWLALAFSSVAAYEGLALATYPDVGGVPTICYGETRGVMPGETKTKAECDAMLSARLVEFNEGVNSCLHVDLPDSRRAASVSLAYNIGVAAFCKSTAVRKLNAGDVIGGCNAFLLWNKVKGVTWPGLTTRRMKERDMCLQGVPA